MSVGIGGSQKVDLRSPRPALICVPRGSGIAFYQAQESLRRVAVLRYTTPDEPESQALQSRTSLNSFSFVRVGQSSGWPNSLDKIVNPRQGDNGWLDLAYAPHLRPEGRRRLFALMRRGVFSVNFALWGAPREEFP